MKKKILITLIFLQALFVSTAISAYDDLQVWAIGDCHKINPETGEDFNPFVPKDINIKNYLWDSATNTVTLYGAKNEYVAFQIILEALKTDLKNVTVEFTDFTGPSTISKDNIFLFKEHYINVKKESAWPLPVTGKGWYPDPLIPFDAPKLGAPFPVAEGKNQAVWVDTYIPKESKAGEYRGQFLVWVGGVRVKTVDVVLNVWDFTLPDENHLTAWSNYEIHFNYGRDNNSPKYIKAEESVWKLCHSHRLNALLRHAHIRPEVRYNDYGALDMDYQPYAYRLGKYLDGSIFENKLSPDIFLLPLSGGTEHRWPSEGPTGDPDASFAYACKDFATYFREMGWGDMLDNSYIYLSDETDEAGLDKIIHDAEIIHNADKDLKTMVALYTIFSEETVEKLAGSVDLWLVDAMYFDSRILKERQKLGEKAGFYQQCEPYIGNENLDADGLAFRTWPWIAWKYGVDVIYLYHMTLWNNKNVWENPENISWSRNQGILLYPGDYIKMNQVMASVRLKQLRRGMQDYEYMFLAKKNKATPERVVDSIIKYALDEARRSQGNYGEWVRDPQEWFTARRNLARLILDEELIEQNPKKIPKVNFIKEWLKKIRDRFTFTKKELWLNLPEGWKEPFLGFYRKFKTMKKEATNAKQAVASESMPLNQNPHKTQEEGQINITVYPDRKLRKISPLLYGSNLVPRSESDRKIWDFVKERGITCFRFPGGGSPGWHWKTGTADFNEKFVNMPLARIDYLIKFCQKTNTSLIMQVNIETGTPEEAAALVDYMNNKKQFKVTYWELGNEAYGDWDKAYTTPDDYAKTIKKYSIAMKRIDPSIKIGADWGGKFYDSVNWDSTIIERAADYIDFVSIHWYPNHINRNHKFRGRVHPLPEEIMANSEEIPNIVKRVQDLIEKYAPHRKGKIEVTFLEWDGSWDAPSNDPPPYESNRAIWSLANAIFYADSLGKFAENGITVSNHYMLQECMFGLIRGWDIAEGWGGEKWDRVTIRPKAFALEMFSKHFGDNLVESKVIDSPFYRKENDWWPGSYDGEVPYVSCYASLKGPKLCLIIINKHSSKDFNLKISINDIFQVTNSGKGWMLTAPSAKAQNDGSPRTVKVEEIKLNNVDNDFDFRLEPHSVVAIELNS